MESEEVLIGDQDDSTPSGLDLTLKQLYKAMRSSITIEKNWIWTYEVFENFIQQVECTALDFSEFMRMHPSEPEFSLKVLRKFAADKASTIQEFTIHQNSGETIANPPKLEQAMWTEIARLKNLEKIVIKCHCFSLNDLVNMCKALPKVQNVIVVIDSADRSALNHPDFSRRCRESFRQLEFFEYELTGDIDNEEVIGFQKKLTNLLILNLPNIRKIECCDLFCNMSPACKGIQVKSKLELLELFAINMDKDAEYFDKFPQVKTLHVNFCHWNKSRPNQPDITKGIEKLGKFRLKYLKLIDLTSKEHLELILSTCGRGLKGLELFFNIHTKCDTRLKVDLSLIQERCPKLKELFICEADVDDSNSLAEFTSLVDLHISINNRFPRNLSLLNLLAAPRLKNVHLSNFQVTTEELMSTIYLIKVKSFLTNIQWICLKLDEDVHISKHNQSLIEDFIEAVKGIRKKDAPVVMIDYN